MWGLEGSLLVHWGGEGAVTRRRGGMELPQFHCSQSSRLLRSPVCFRCPFPDLTYSAVTLVSLLLACPLLGLTLYAAPLTLLPQVGPEDVDSVGQPIDGKLYATFWGLQATFKVPDGEGRRRGGEGIEGEVDASRTQHIVLHPLGPVRHALCIPHFLTPPPPLPPTGPLPSSPPLRLDPLQR